MKNSHHTSGQWANGTSAGVFNTSFAEPNFGGSEGGRSALCLDRAHRSGWRNALSGVALMGLVLLLVTHPMVLLVGVALLCLYAYTCRKLSTKAKGV